MKLLTVGLLSLVLFAPGFVEAGTGRQTTTFLVDANTRTVCRWIEQARPRSTRARAPRSFRSTVASRSCVKRPKRERSRSSFDHEPEQSAANRQRQFRTVLVKSDNPNARLPRDQHPCRTRGKRLARDDHRRGHGDHAQRDGNLARHSARAPRHAQAARKPLRLARMSEGSAAHIALKARAASPRIPALRCTCGDSPIARRRL